MVGPNAAHPFRQRPARAAAIPLLLVVALLGACSADGDSASGSTTTNTEDNASSTTSPTSTSTSTTQPPGTDLAAVEPIIAELLSQRDELAAQIRQDPTLISDQDDGPFAEYAALFTVDSPQLTDFRESVQRVAGEGHADRPGPSGVLEATHLDAMLPSDSADVALFQVCAFSDFETYDVESGETVAAEAVKVVSGGEARRVDGVWLLYDFLDPDPNLVETLPSGTANPCELEG